MVPYNPDWMIRNPKYNQKKASGKGPREFRKLQHSSILGAGDATEIYNFASILKHAGLLPIIEKPLQDILDDFGLEMGSDHLGKIMCMDYTIALRHSEHNCPKIFRTRKSYGQGI